MSILMDFSNDKLAIFSIDLRDPLGKFVEVGTPDGPDELSVYESEECTARTYRMDPRAAPSSASDIDAFNRMSSAYGSLA